MAELVAAGCGDWDALEASWSLARVRALHRHWRRAGPPAHVSLAALAGWRPQGEAVRDRVDDPEEVLARLRAMGVVA